MARPGTLFFLALTLLVGGCGYSTPGLVQVDMLAERQRLEEAYPDAVGFALLSPVNNGLVLNLDGSGTYILNPGSRRTEQGLVLLPFEYVPISVTEITSEAVCTNLGCLTLGRMPDGALFCEIRWNNGDHWPKFPCYLRPIPPGFDVTTIRRQEL